MPIREALQIVSWLALAATIVPSCLYLAGQLELGTVKTAMFAATVAWFAATPLWIGRQPGETSAG